MLIDNNLINWLKLTWKLVAIKDIFFNTREAWSMTAFKTVDSIVSYFTLRSSTSSPFSFSATFWSALTPSWSSVYVYNVLSLLLYVPALRTIFFSSFNLSLTAEGKVRVSNNLTSLLVAFSCPSDLRLIVKWLTEPFTGAATRSP